MARRREVGLALGKRMYVSCYGMLGYALLSSATLGDAFHLAMQYPALLGTLFPLRLIEDGERIGFSASNYGEDPKLATFNAEFCLTSLKVFCDDLLGQALPLLASRFAHAGPAYQAL